MSDNSNPNRNPNHLAELLAKAKITGTGAKQSTSAQSKPKPKSKHEPAAGGGSGYYTQKHGHGFGIASGGGSSGSGAPKHGHGFPSAKGGGSSGAPKPATATNASGANKAVNVNVNKQVGDQPAAAAAVKPADQGVTFDGGPIDVFLAKFLASEPAAGSSASAGHSGSKPKSVAVIKPKTENKFRKHRESLPVFQFKEKFLKMMRENQTIIVVGETGCGKSTQLPQYLYEAGFADAAKIGCTQPRRVAAKSVAQQVAKEVGTELGELVGFRIRFEDCTAPHTVITYMTDGCLLNQFYSQPNLDSYSVIMLDEAHERSINTDVLFGLLKELSKRRKDLKLIITSATLDAGKFAEYFNAPILEIAGRAFPVDIIYSPSYQDCSDWLTISVRQVMNIHKREPEGDILVFLPGRDEIELACDQIYKLYMVELQVYPSSTMQMKLLPCYSALPWDMQNEIFEPVPAGTRKVIVATNVAETSLTVENIVYIVDSGVMKQTEYNPKTGVATLIVMPITKAQAKQRTGRAGRTKPGKAYRMYTESAFEEMQPTQIPEIQRANVEEVVLQLFAIGIRDIVSFDYMDPPSTEAFQSAILALVDLSALDATGQLTSVGQKMAYFPLAPNLAKVLITSAELGCSEEILTIVAMLSTQNQNFFSRPKKQSLLAETKRAAFFQPLGDHFTMLKLYNDWCVQQKSAEWCKNNFIQTRNLEEAHEIRKQLAGLLDSNELRRSSCGLHVDRIQKALCSGFFAKVAQKGFRYSYTITASSKLTDGDGEVLIHPSSALFKKNPEWLIYNEVLKTNRPYMRQVVTIDPVWIRQYAPNFFHRHFSTSGGSIRLKHMMYVDNVNI